MIAAFLEDYWWVILIIGFVVIVLGAKKDGFK